MPTPELLVLVAPTGWTMPVASLAHRRRDWNLWPAPARQRLPSITHVTSGRYVRRRLQLPDA